MRLIGNVIWLICGGLAGAILYFVAGAVQVLTVIGIPFGLQSFKLGLAMLWPFGREVVDGPRANSGLRVLLNVVWLVLFGWELVLFHLACTVVLALTIVGIPFAVQHVKLAGLALVPFGRMFERRAVPAGVA